MRRPTTRQVAFGAMERPFYAQMLQGLGLNDVDVSQQDERARWPDLRRRIAEIIRGRTRDEWERHFAAFDAASHPSSNRSRVPTTRTAVVGMRSLKSEVYRSPRLLLDSQARRAHLLDERADPESTRYPP